MTASIKNGQMEKHREPLVRLLSKYQCCFATEFLVFTPAEVEPLSLQLVKDAQPVRGRFRTYAPLMVQVMKEHVDKLLSAGFIYENTSSRWSSPCYLEKSIQNDHRLSVGVNRMIQPKCG